MEFKGVRYSGKVVSTINKVTTLPRSGRSVVQHHRGFYGLALVEGGPRNGTRCGHFHQKAKSAKACAERTARAIIRERSEESAP